MNFIRDGATLVCQSPLGQNRMDLKTFDPEGRHCLKLEKRTNLQTKAVYKSIPLWEIGLRGVFVSFKIVGIGYRVFLSENTLTFKLGFSHLVQVLLPKSVKVFLPEPNVVCLFGLDVNQLTQIMATIRHIKVPSIYKGKGIQRVDEVIRLKAGKRKT
jgi:large subunit ribosomal protein L6